MGVNAKEFFSSLMIDGYFPAESWLIWFFSMIWAWLFR